MFIQPKKNEQMCVTEHDKMEQKLNSICNRFLNLCLEEHQVPNYFDQHLLKIGETYRIRVSYIYDISKFWIVLKEQELTLFQKFIHQFYSKQGKQYKIPLEVLQSKMYCVAFTEGSFYRGLVVDISFHRDCKQKALVLLIDYGQVLPVEFEHLYYFYDKFYQTPSFAVRACISQIEPCNSDIWTSNVIQRFNELVSEKVLLCVLENIDFINKIVYVTIGNVDEHSQVHDIGDRLLNENLAIPMSTKPIRKRKFKNIVPTTFFPFLFPTFEAIERDEAPALAKVFNSLRHSQMSRNVLDTYYIFDGIYNSNI